MFDRLMGWAILTQPDAVMCVNPDAGIMRKCREPNGRSHIIREDQEGSTIRDDSTINGHPIDNRPHSMLTHSKMKISTFRGSFLKIRAIVDPGIIRRGQV